MRTPFPRHCRDVKLRRLDASLVQPENRFRPGRPARNVWSFASDLHFGIDGPADWRDNPMELPDLRSIDELEDLLLSGPHLYVRYSEGYEHDRETGSVDTESGPELPGRSVNPLRPEPWWTRPPRDWLARQLCQYEHLKEKNPNGMPGSRAGAALHGAPIATPFSSTSSRSPGSPTGCSRKPNGSTRTGSRPAPAPRTDRPQPKGVPFPAHMTAGSGRVDFPGSCCGLPDAPYVRWLRCFRSRGRTLADRPLGGGRSAPSAWPKPATSKRFCP